MMLALLPLLLLIAALGSVIFYQRASNELSRVLAVGMGAVCLIWGFAIAHWSIHLLCLILLLQYKKLLVLFSPNSVRVEPLKIQK
ncbi:hypothetical protein IQ249_17210 [Lusitaniella coriacea LEGE 07157]|uniref:Uncharacterized protein n=1 Tax=Lusitaniella coriacea LEGE 07157 TaxID=945747 RepID=A0A8J7JCH3_9CYAN|nr:hypothetical protein [Lusitaniella coriacea]MBE9117640.1 hypothetical protein [Lusitaniella coriacea LEGE 07157]